MSRGAPAALALGLLAAQVAGAIGGVVLAIGNGPLASPWQTPVTLALSLAGLLAFPAVGAAVVVRRPRNPVGWLFLVAPVGYVVLLAGEEYARRGLLVDPGSLPLAAEALWLVQWSWGPSAPLLLTGTLLLFPDGRPPSRRWWPVLWVAAGGAAVATVLMAVRAWPLRTPALLDAPGPVASPVAEPVREVGDLLAALVIVTGAAAVAGLVVRFRRSRGAERQQLKWFVAGAGLLIASFPLRGLLSEDAGSALFAVASAAPPVAAGIAILRHRLWDIDRLLNRTLVYGVLTALLGAAYLGAVAGLQALTAPLAGGGDLAVAASTLAVAAAFRPARDAVQRAVDERFDRRRYDAARAVAAFRAEARDAVDLDALRARLTGAVDQTVQPTRVSVWLRDVGAPQTPGGSRARSPQDTRRGW